MGLVIHDLTADEWKNTEQDYEGWTVISETDMIQPCVGCFGCWNRDPGRCVVSDGFSSMGSLIHQADEVVVISRYTYGGFSGFVKNVFDRSLAYVLPQFEVTGGETHHKKRYDEDKAFTFIFYGSSLTDAEKDSARRYVEAVCANIRGHVRDVIFREAVVTPEFRNSAAGSSDNRVLLLNGSMRLADGNTAKFVQNLSKKLTRGAVSADLRQFVSGGYTADAVKETLDAAGKAPVLVLCVPLYVDGLPSQMIRFMELAERESPGPKKVYVLANMGLYESSQLVNLFSAVRQWCGKMGFEYCGGLGISAGELVGTIIGATPMKYWITSRIEAGMKKLAKAIDDRAVLGDIYAEPYRFPRSLYIQIANTNWKITALKNGIRPGDLYRKL